jgi:uncharacterized protein (UPF0332 family)
MAEALEIEAFMAKAAENLASAESEFANGRFNACANRCYYASFQAAIGALLGAGVHPTNARGEWGHEYVQAQFALQLINRRKLYPAALRDVLMRLLATRQVADYRTDSVSAVQAERALRRAREFVQAILTR